MTEPAPLSDGDYLALARFRYALRVFLRFSEDAARAAGITPAHHQLLLVVRGWDGDGPPSTADLAQRLQLRSHSTVELVQRAGTAGLVATIGDDSDGRIHRVTLTPEGESILASLSLQHRDELSRFRTEMTDILDDLS